MKESDITGAVLQRLGFKQNDVDQYEWYLVLPYGQGVELRFAVVTDDLYLLETEVKDGWMVSEKFIYLRDPKNATDLELMVNASEK